MQERRTTTRAARRALAAALADALVGLAGAPAGAVSLALAPASLHPAPGDVFALDLVISGVPDGTVLGAFDVTLGFDPAAVAFSGVAFDAFLGAIPAEATADFVLGAGTLALAEFSILSAGALDALQPASFRLATITFQAASAAPSTITIASALLGGAAGAPIPVTALAGARIAPIPEPAGALAFAIGVALVARASRRR